MLKNYQNGGNMRFVLLAIALLVTACNAYNDKNHYVLKAGENETAYLKDVDGCPKVHVRRNDAAIIQKEGADKAFAITAIGYEGFCYFNEKTNRYKAVVKPKFKISRLVDVDVTDVHFSYYLETVEGPQMYLGKKTYFAEVNIPKGAQEMEYMAQKGELSIPPSGTYDLDIYLGLNADISDLQYKK